MTFESMVPLFALVLAVAVIAIVMWMEGRL